MIVSAVLGIVLREVRVTWQEVGRTAVRTIEKARKVRSQPSREGATCSDLMNVTA
jgi:hypothetical protein